MISQRAIPEARRSRYGWVPDLPDKGDKRFGSLHPLPDKFPTLVDLRPYCSPVEHQGDVGSSTAHALAGALEFLEVKDQLRFVNLSRLFIYYNQRAKEGTVGSDSGAMLRDGLKSLLRVGACSEANWPYTPSHLTHKPAKGCYLEAERHTIGAYARLESLDEMRACLASGFPFVFGFSVYERFESAQVARAGVVPLPEIGERLLGGHAALVVGYDDAGNRFIVKNSWGTGWGMKGYFTIPYGYLEDSDLARDFWTLRRGEIS